MEPQSYLIHNIDTRSVFFYLSDVEKSKWKKYDRTFLQETVQGAIQLALWGQGTISIKYDGKNGDYLNGYRDARYNAHLEHASLGDNFPFPDYFLRPDPDSDYHSIVQYSEHCLIKKDHSSFSLFFALQFSLTDIIEGMDLLADEFLEHHLKHTFDNDIPKFKKYLDGLCLKYDFLKGTHETIITQFFDRLTQEDRPEKANVNALKAEKLRWSGTPSQFGYLLLELAKKGFIDLPTTGGEASYAKYAKVSSELFDFQTPTTLENLKKEFNPNKNTLSETVRSKFSIPELTEISKISKK
jgi:hypothetical protein